MMRLGEFFFVFFNIMVALFVYAVYLIGVPILKSQTGEQRKSSVSKLFTILVSIAIVYIIFLVVF